MARINYDNLKIRTCLYCKEDYLPTGPAQKACIYCQKLLSNLNSQVILDTERMKKFGTYEKVGKGFSNKKYTEHGQYTNGLGFFANTLRPAVKSRRYCERCNKDLQEAGNYEWCAHHRDGDRSNNVIDNIELLCKRCHQIHHDCAKQLNV